MKKFLLSCAVLFLAVGGAYAQSYIFVNSEKVFKSQNDYNTAIQQLDDLAKQYQKNVDDAYQTLEEAYIRPRRITFPRRNAPPKSRRLWSWRKRCRSTSRMCWVPKAI